MPSKVMRGQELVPWPQGWLPLPSHPPLTRRLEHPAAAVAQALDTPWTGDLSPQHPGRCGTPTGLRPSRTSGDAPARPPRPHTSRLGGGQRGCAGARGRTAAGAPPLTCAGLGGRSAGGQGGGRGAAVSPVPTGLKRAARARPRGGPRTAWGRGLLGMGGAEMAWGWGLVKLGGIRAGPGWLGGERGGPCGVGRGQSRLGPGFGKWAGPKGRGRGGPGRAGGGGSGFSSWAGPGRSMGGPRGGDLRSFSGPRGGAEQGRVESRRERPVRGRSLTERTRVGGAGQRWSLGQSLQWCGPEEGRAQIQGWGFAS